MAGRRSRFYQSGGGSEKAADQFSALDFACLVSHPCFLPQVGKIQSVSNGRPPKNLSFYAGRDLRSLGPRSVWDHLESFKRNCGEKLDRISSVSTRLLCCHWPQINCQESGSEQMWPTLNWLHQHSLSFSLALSCKASAEGPLCLEADHNMGVSHYKHTNSSDRTKWSRPWDPSELCNSQSGYGLIVVHWCHRGNKE